MTRTVVIGGGIAGLATAALLAREGHAVTLLEQHETVGGRAGEWVADTAAGTFRFETGPSWYLMPEVFEHFFALFGTDLADRLELATLDPGYRVYFERPDADPVDIRTDGAANIALFESIEPGAGGRLRRYLDEAADAYDVAVDRFLYTTWRRIGPVVDAGVLRRLPRLVGLLTSSLERRIARRFRDGRLRQVLGYPAVFLGSSPDRAPALYSLMSRLDLDDGVRYPMGGFRALIDAIAALARDEGVDIRTGCRVDAILTAPDAAAPTRGRPRVTGVRLRTPDGADGAETVVDADVVVGAADLHHVETRLLPAELQTYPSSWWERRVAGPGAVLVLLGVEGALPQLAHHTLVFTEDWQRNFDAIFGAHPHVPDPASLYVCRPSATDDVAPAGHENLFVLVPVPADPGIGRGGVDGAGDALVEQTADRAIAAIAEATGVTDLAERIVVRRTIAPGDFAADLNSWRGTSLGPAHTLRQSALFRGRVTSAKVDGLFYAGGSTIPGIGLPMCLISAELVLKAVRGDDSPGPLTTPIPAPSERAATR